MGDLLQTGSDWLEGQRHEHLSHAVTYHRGAESVALNVTVGQTTFEVEREFGVEKVESRDFLFRDADLVLAGQPAEFKSSHRLHFIIRPGAGAAFRKARDLARAAGWTVGWNPIEEGVELEIGAVPPVTTTASAGARSAAAPR